MKCPHCNLGYHQDDVKPVFVGEDRDGEWFVHRSTCPECRRLHLHVRCSGMIAGSRRIYHGVTFDKLVYPGDTTRPPAPSEVTDSDIAADYNEARLVLAESPKAAAALGRRCLQHLLATKANATHRNLAEAIQHVLDQNMLPSDIAESIDAVRHIGNFAAHPMKSQQSGEIVEVEPGEAEWTLEVLEELFEYWYVRPARMAERRAKLNEKLDEAGKPSMKQPTTDDRT